MRTLLLLTLFLSIGFLLSTCGDETPDTEPQTRFGGGLVVELKGRPALRGQGWLDAVDIEPFKAADRVRVVFFFKPSEERSQKQGAVIAQLLAGRNVLFVGATPSTDQQAIEAFRQRLGLRLPVLYGLAPESRALFMVNTLPALRLYDEKGRLAARDLITLRSRYPD